MRRVEEMFSARRNSVSSSSAVGNTLNSTGLRIYIETSRTMTETVIVALIRMSSRNGGMGMTIARTMPRTARGMLNSAGFPKRGLTAGTATGALAGCAFSLRSL
jgi:hypothetical protein